MAISRASSALAGKEVVLQIISTHIGAPAVPTATPSREIDSDPFAGIVANDVSNSVAGEAKSSCAWTDTGPAFGLITTTFPKTVQKKLILFPVLS
jgi:hypothetical protein